MPGRSGSPSARRASGCSAWSTTCWPTVRSSRTARPRRPSCAPSPTWRPARRTTSRTPWRPRRWRGHTGCPPAAVQQALRDFRPDGHRIAEVAVIDDVTWIDDSKATNPHAALASLQAYDPVVWVAGGLAKGAGSTTWSSTVRDRLRGVVLLGRDAPVIRESLSRHAPDVPVIEVGSGETAGEEPMDRVVGGARRWHSPETRCSWPRDAPPWTCSPTTAHAATPSPRPCTRDGRG